MDAILIHVSSGIVFSFLKKTLSTNLLKSFFNAVLVDLTH